MSMNFEEFHKKMEDPEFRDRGAICCNKCGEKLDAIDLQDPPRKIDGKQVCSDCWFGEFGKVLDKHPI